MDAQAKFTPGPWRIAGSGTIRQGDSIWIARVNWRNRAANARLIAAAPDLYEALQGLLKHYEPEHSAGARRVSYPPTHPLERARTALSKARATPDASSEKEARS